MNADKDPNIAPDAEYDYNEFTGKVERVHPGATKPNDDLSSDAQETMHSYTRYSSIAFQMLAAMLLGVGGGLFLDKYLHTSPWLTVVFSLLGVAFAMHIIIKQTR